ncbi:MAG: hypothetical protein WDA74_06530 [Spirochaetota bacterium]
MDECAGMGLSSLVRVTRYGAWNRGSEEKVSPKAGNGRRYCVHGSD